MKTWGYRNGDQGMDNMGERRCERCEERMRQCVEDAEKWRQNSEVLMSVHIHEYVQYTINTHLSNSGLQLPSVM